MVRQPGALDDGPAAPRELMRQWALDAAAREARVAARSRFVRVIGGLLSSVGVAMTIGHAQDVVAGITRYPASFLVWNGALLGVGAWLAAIGIGDTDDPDRPSRVAMIGALIALLLGGLFGRSLLLPVLVAVLR